jgi:hypothetical protein
VHHHSAVIEGTHVLRVGEIAPLRTGGVQPWCAVAGATAIPAVVGTWP